MSEINSSENPSLQEAPPPANLIRKIPTRTAKQQRRVRALKKLLLIKVGIEEQFHKDFHDLSAKYQAFVKPLYLKRKEIVTGLADREDDGDDYSQPPQSLIPQPSTSKYVPLVQKGIPEFWLQVLKNAALMKITINPTDEEALKSLIDITSYNISSEPRGFKVEFHFEENDFFENSVLTKTYELDFTPKSEELLNYKGPYMFRCTGCEIKWKPGMNLTIDTIKKDALEGNIDQDNSEIVVRKDSFFLFFEPPTEKFSMTIGDYKMITIINHFDIGYYLHERIVPMALLYYTQEARECGYIHEVIRDRERVFSRLKIGT